MRELNKLSAAFIKHAPKGKYGDGGGLWLHKADKDRGKWVLLVTIHGKRREMGLGTLNDVPLKDAREQAGYWRGLVRAGKDPIKERERERRAAQRNMHLLQDIARDAFESRKADLKGDGKAGRWFSPLELHVLPRLGKVPVSDLDQIDIHDTLKPIWDSKAATAKKALNRLGICLQHAAALGLDVDLQATDKARALLGRQRHTEKHIPALPWQDVPAFYSCLQETTPTHLALRMLILTGVRSYPIRHMHLDQIEGDTWTIPSESMKGRKGATDAFRVPLPRQALEIASDAAVRAREGFLFPSPRRGVLSDATMARLMERRGMEARPHGFRSSFRDWVEEKTQTPYEVAEMSLGHTVGGTVERAYRRTDHLDARRILMQRWADFVSAESATIVRIG
ncbi:integrase arm-type DNA-binding domain-containing protein [Aliiroseovarius sp. M344]|uniref:tyrosine-type recombinase/integrase n=1 Tax=Aliiroseovarius sp. M344 TaxID=2867010 RepID=UPI0021ADAEFC|nr:site-specific integrase [Aliiroseovarius sp. M344]UWQ14198.1 integrase arm-type DNA-binding domain-containing protein [Aliiroseovarius sp. M344]